MGISVEVNAGGGGVAQSGSVESGDADVDSGSVPLESGGGGGGGGGGGHGPGLEFDERGDCGVGVTWCVRFGVGVLTVRRVGASAGSISLGDGSKGLWPTNNVT